MALLDAGVSVRAAARQLECSPSTIVGARARLAKLEGVDDGLYRRARAARRAAVRDWWRRHHRDCGGCGRCTDAARRARERRGDGSAPRRAPGSARPACANRPTIGMPLPFGTIPSDSAAGATAPRSLAGVRQRERERLRGDAATAAARARFLALRGRLGSGGGRRDTLSDGLGDPCRERPRRGV